MEWTKDTPQVDGYYWWRGAFTEEIVERFRGEFYFNSSRFALNNEDVAARRGEWLGPITSSQAQRYDDMVPYEDQTCIECRYGAIDSSGLCVIDATHKAVG